MEFVSVVSACLGIVGALIGGAGWFAGAVKKSYAAEREFMHLRSVMQTGYSDISVELKELISKVERIELKLLEIELKKGDKAND